MKPLSALIITGPDETSSNGLLQQLSQSPLVEKIIVVAGKSIESLPLRHTVVASPFPWGGAAVSGALELAGPCDYVLSIPAQAAGVDITPDELERLYGAARKERAGGLFYADYFDEHRDTGHVKKVCDYREGSLRDDFNFGPVQLYSMQHLRQAFETHGPLTDSRRAGLYELRLKVSLAGGVVHIPEALSLLTHSQKKSHFSYVDPRQLDYQEEMEAAATEHLKRLGACCTHVFFEPPADPAPYPVEASIVIPVRNREKTIADAIRSALSQKTDFPFNVIVVQNHSTDKTASEIDAIAQHDARVIHLVPERTGLGIGGCWNEAVCSPRCGRYVCQLDSDDLYADENTLAAMAGILREGTYGMAVGSYRVVNFDLEEIPPGIIDHREWSDENGRNNLLRVNGIGAPRAFVTALLRKHPFPNVSYGEDYAVSLRLSRDYRVGRIYEPVYLCRRWEDNTDALLTNEQEVKHAMYKDSLRTQEIEERRKRQK